MPPIQTQASGIAEHSGLMSAALEFSKCAASIQTRFVQQVLDTVKQVCPVQPHAAHDSVDGKLTLIEEQDFGDWLAAATEVHKLDEMDRAQLFYIEPRIGQLLDFDCNHSNNPFGPAVIGLTYRSALRDVPVSARARQVAYATLRCATCCPVSSPRCMPNCWRCCLLHRLRPNARKPAQRSWCSVLHLRRMKPLRPPSPHPPKLPPPKLRRS